MTAAANRSMTSTGARSLLLLLAALTIGVLALARTGTAAAAPNCGVFSGCPAVFGFAPFSPGDLGDTSVTLTFYADASSVALGDDFGWHVAYGETGGPLSQTASNGDTIVAGTFAPHTITVTGLQPVTSYDFLVVATDGLGHEVDNTVATVTTLDVCAAGHCLELSDVTVPNTYAGAVDVTAKVHTGGSDTQWHVEWQSGAETGYPHAGPTQTVPGGPGDVYSTVHLTGLSPSTTYTAIVVGENSAAQGAQTGPFTFSTLDACSAGTCPSILSSFTQVVSDTAEDVGANVATQGLPTQWYLEYGPTASYGTATLPATLNADGQVIVHLTGLAPGAGYHYRFVAQNLSGTAVQPDRQFTTDSPCNWGHCVTITGEGAASVGPHGATVFATIGTGGFDTDWTIEAWTGSVPPQTVGSGTIAGSLGSDTVSAQLTGLAGATAYSFRVTGTSANGSTSATGTFTTQDPCDLGLCADPRQPSVTGITDTEAYVIAFVGTKNAATDWQLELLRRRRVDLVGRRQRLAPRRPGPGERDRLVPDRADAADELPRPRRRRQRPGVGDRAERDLLHRQRVLVREVPRRRCPADRDACHARQSRWDDRHQGRRHNVDARLGHDERLRRRQRHGHAADRRLGRREPGRAGHADRAAGLDDLPLPDRLE